MRMSREEQMKYDHALKVYRDNLMFEQGYKDGLKKAMEEGKEKGREEGRLEGREEGRLEGREEGRIEVAKEMIRNGMQFDTVAKISGLPIEKVKDIRT